MRRAASVILESGNINEPDDPGAFNAAIEHYNTASVHPEFDEEMKAKLMQAIENRKSEIAFGIFRNALDRKYALLQSTDGSLVNQDVLHVINPVVKDDPNAISEVMQKKIALLSMRELYKLVWTNISLAVS